MLSYESISYDDLSDDDLLVIKFSIDANDKLMQGLVEKRTFEFQKQKQAVFITRNEGTKMQRALRIIHEGESHHIKVRPFYFLHAKHNRSILVHHKPRLYRKVCTC